jgi:hypothetical protein
MLFKVRIGPNAIMKPSIRVPYIIIIIIIISSWYLNDLFVID